MNEMCCRNVNARPSGTIDDTVPPATRRALELLDHSGVAIVDDHDMPGEHLHNLSAAAWAALESGNDPPRLFQHGGAIAEVRRDEDGRHLILLDQLSHSVNCLLRVARRIQRRAWSWSRMNSSAR